MSDDATQKTTLDQWLERKKGKSITGIQKKPENEASILSHGQERLWLLEQLYSGQNLYSYAHRYKIAGKVNVDFLIESFQRLVEKHEVLRTTYHETNGTVVQKVHDFFSLSITHIDSNDHSTQVDRIEKAPFDLENDLPIRIGIHQISTEETEVILVLHHIAGDAWSMNIINKELSTSYEQLVNETAEKRIKSDLQYKDYSFWQRNQKVKEEDLVYWKEHLKDETDELKLPLNSSSNNSFKGKWLRKEISSQLVSQIKETVKESNVTLYSYWLATFKLFLSKYSNQATVTVGSPFSNRDKKELEGMIGFFNETLVLRSDFTDDPSFSSIVSAAGETVLNGISHKNVPFELLVNELKPDRVAGENPLFKAMFLYNGESTKLSIPNTKIDEETVDLGVSKFDLTLFVNEKQGGIELVFEYTSNFDDAMIQSMMDHYEILLKNIVSNPTSKISQLSILSESEKSLLTKKWNDTLSPIPHFDNIAEIISQHASDTPQATAVSFNEESLTYEELDQWSNTIANDLINKGIKSGEFVGIYTQRSLEMVAAIIGVLKSGAAYLPLDPKYPEKRIQYMLEDSKAKYILIQPSENPPSLDVEVEMLSLEKSFSQKIAPVKSNPNDYAYIIYTSGSTGQPKGVAVSHQNLIQSTTARFSFYEKEVKSFLLLSSFSFDSSVVGIFWTLCAGGTLVLPPDRIEQDISRMTEIIRKQKVSHTLLLPSLYQVLLSYADLKNLTSLSTVIVAGEAVSEKLRKEHFSKLPKTLLYNEYGPTEATVWCIAHEITESEKGIIPIGKPIPNTFSYVVDRHLNPLPIGVEGNLFIGGNSVTDGYLNNPELTTQKFLSNPFTDGRIYDTGDLAKWNNEGSLHFLGRRDAQIKIRGHRVETEEIKQAFYQIDGVQEVEIKIDGEEKKRIVAYVQAADQLEESYLLDTVKETLPDHMIPSHVIVLDSFPTLPNGKIDTSKFPAPDESNSSEYVAPTNELEKSLVEIWIEVLKIDAIGVHDNFFDIGGDSIRSIQVIAKAKAKDIRIEATALFQYQTVYKLARGIQQREDNHYQDSWSSIIPMKATGSAPPLFCIHSGGAHVMFYRDFANEIGEEHPIYAIQPKGLDSGQSFHETIPEMAAHYIEEIKKVQSTGPYHLLSTCFSNAVGLDMIHQLREKGDEVAVMYVIDSAPAYLIPPSPNGERMPVRRMIGMIKEGNWDGIFKKFRNRFILANRKVNASRTSEVQKDLYEMIGSLNELYSRYTWRPIDTNIILIRSSEFSSRKGKQFHLDHWTMLSKSNLEIHEVDGHHKTLFQKPEVYGLAKKISEHKTQLHKPLS